METTDAEKIKSLLYAGERELAIELAKSVGLYEPFMKSVIKLYRYLYANRFCKDIPSYTYLEYDYDGNDKVLEEGIYAGTCMASYLVIKRKEAIILYCSDLLLRGLLLNYKESSNTYCQSVFGGYIPPKFLGLEDNRNGYSTMLLINIYEWRTIDNERIEKLQQLGVKIIKDLT